MPLPMVTFVHGKFPFLRSGNHVSAFIDDVFLEFRSNKSDIKTYLSVAKTDFRKYDVEILLL